MRSNVGLNTDYKKPKVVQDMYKSNLVTGDSMKTRASGNVPREKVRPVNQYGSSRIIGGKK